MRPNEHALAAQIVKTYRGVDDVRGLSLRHSAGLLSRPLGKEQLLLKPRWFLVTPDRAKWQAEDC